jgi:hypothetical protein
VASDLAMPLSREELIFGATQKLERAEYHINDLTAQINAYLIKKPMRLVTVGNRKTGDETHFLKEQIPVPIGFSLVLGDALHNLRCALDIVIFNMIGDRAKRPDRVQFPITWDDDTFIATLKKREIEIAGKNVVDELKTLKPYRGGNDKLWGLHLLDIADKHKLLLTVNSTAEMSSIEFAKVLPGLKGFPNVNVRFGKDTNFVGKATGGTRSQRRAHRRNIRIGEYERDIQPAFEICFGEGPAFSNGPVIPILIDLTGYVRSICSRLIDAFLRP